MSLIFMPKHRSTIPMLHDFFVPVDKIVDCDWLSISTIHTRNL